MDENLIAIGILVAVNSPLYFLIGKILFRSWDGFGEALYFLIKPDMLSWFSGEGWDDMWNELKLFFFVIVCALLTYSEWHFLMK